MEVAEEGFDVWLRNRFHIDNSDMPDIFSHIDPNLDSLPNGVDEMLSWLNPAGDLVMDDPEGALAQLTSGSAAAAAPAGPAAPLQAAQANVPAQQQQHHHQQHHVSDWQLAYLQQTVQQPIDLMQAQQYSEQQQMMLGANYPPQHAAGVPVVPGLFQFDPSTAALYGGWQGDSQAAAAAVAAGDGAGDQAGVGAGMEASVQNAGSSGRSSGSSKQQQGSRGRIGKQPGGGRKPRKVTDAQRAAHKRFRLRRKEQVSSLVAEVESKQAQLQALEAEHEALTAKARALDQLVASAGDSMVLMQHMEALSLEPKKQQQQQQPTLQLPAAPAAAATPASSSAAAAAAGGCCVKQEQGVVDHAAAAAAAPSAAAAGLASTAGPGTDSSLTQGPCSSAKVLDQQLSAPGGNAAADTPQAPGTDATGHGKSSGSMAAAAPAGAAAAVGQLTNAGSELAAAGLHGSNDSSGGSPSSPSAAAAASLERLETAVRQALGRPYLPPLHQQQQRQLQLGSARVQQLQQLRAPASHALQLQGTLPALQQLTKSLVNEIMQLVLQVNKEQTTAAAGGEGGNSSGGSTVGGVQVSAAAARLQHIRQQVLGEFRAFASTNRIDICLLHTLNLETGMLVRPPPGHWVPGAQLLMQRLDLQTLQDIVVAHKLYTDTLRKVSEQRRMMLMQLHAALRESTSASNSRYQTDSCYPSKYTGQSFCAIAVQLLEAIDSNLRKEYVMEGVFQWSFNKLLPPLVASELVVTSYPFLPDYHHIATELMQLLPPPPDLAAATQAVQQQQLDQQQLDQQQQQQLEVYPAQDLAQAGYYLEQQPYEQQQIQQAQMQLYAPHYLQQQQQQQLLLQQGYGLGRQMPAGVVPSTQPLAMTFLSTPCG